MTIERERVRHELRRRELTVKRVREVVPGIVRVTLGGDDLTGFVSLGPADHLKVFFPDPATGEIAAPSPGEIEIGRQSAAPVLRDYTPLAFRAEAEGGPELDIDFVIHESDGPAVAWASRAKQGDRIAIGGPRGFHLPPTGAGSAIIIADESALPTARRWMEVFAEKTPVIGLFWVESASTNQYFEGREFGADLRWFAGDGNAEALEQELRSLPIDADTFVFLAGEAGTLVPLRRYLRRELGLPAIQVDAHGYWKRGEAGRDHHAPLDPADPD
ncbi:MAG: siderophore-interacting protein [Cryobacterium sp.]|nr:siderophore-interacting protein [Cryobacterium sp.]MBX3090059.1 siderophore-interacting protein [Cryobacterium sp.]